MLQLNFDDVVAEQSTQKFAGRGYRADFHLRENQVYIELKFAREGLKDNELANALDNDYMRLEGSSDDWNLFFCFVYDPNKKIRNRTQLIKDLESSHSKMRVVITD